MNARVNIERTSRFRLRSPRRRFLLGRLLQGLLMVTALAYISYVPEPVTIAGGKLKVGDIAKEDIIVKRDITVEDKEVTEQNRQKILNGLIPIYSYQSDKVDAALVQIGEFFAFMNSARRETVAGTLPLSGVREKAQKELGLDIPEPNLQSLLQSGGWLRTGLNPILAKVREWAEHGILVSKPGSRKSRENLVILVSPGKESLVTKLDAFYDQKEVEQKLGDFLGHEARLSDLRLESAQSLLMDMIPVTVTYAKEQNQAQEKRALDILTPSYIRLKRDKVIIRRGEEVTAEQMKWISLIHAVEMGKSRHLSNFYFIWLVWLLAFLFLTRYLSDKNKGHRALEVTFVTLLFSAIVYRIFLFLMPLILRTLMPLLEGDIQGISYAIPFGFGAMIIAFLFNLENALIFSLANSVLAGIMCDWSIKISILVLISNLAVALGVDCYQRLKRSTTLKAGFFWLFPVNAGFVLAMTITGGSFTWKQLSLYLLLAAFSAVTAALFANFIIPLWEVLFKLITDLKLVEITNLDLPIFRDMLEKAPGTYHHSQMVASLAEATAEEMGLSPLLLRAMALYHDVGKLESPHLFVENHAVYEDPHPRLSPQESAKAIIAHIPAGLEIAEQLKLPPRISDAITRHHGTKRVKYFYQKAVEGLGGKGEEVNEDLFRYPGPKPQEIEDAIVMLADQVEAATKSLSAPNDEELRSVIEQMIDSNIQENQFDECRGLTFMALHSIAACFFDKLSSIYHQRVSYPGFQFSKGKANGQNNQH